MKAFFMNLARCLMPLGFGRSVARPKIPRPARFVNSATRRSGLLTNRAGCGPLKARPPVRIRGANALRQREGGSYQNKLSKPRLTFTNALAFVYEFFAKGIAEEMRNRNALQSVKEFRLTAGKRNSFTDCLAVCLRIGTESPARRVRP